MPSTNFCEDMKLFQISIIILLILHSSCNKNRTHTLEGRIMYNCETPLANANLELREHYYSQGLIKAFKTDENGYFRLTYPDLQDNSLFSSGHMDSEIEIVSAGTDSVAVNYYYIPGNKNFNFKTMPILRIRKDYDIYLEVNSPYTADDTLHFYDYTKENPYAHPIKVPGPFQSGLLYSVENGIVRSGHSDFSKLPIHAPEINLLDELEVKPNYSYNIKGPGLYKPSVVKADFGLQCEDGNYQLTLVID